MCRVGQKTMPLKRKMTLPSVKSEESHSTTKNSQIVNYETLMNMVKGIGPQKMTLENEHKIARNTKTKDIGPFTAISGPTDMLDHSVKGSRLFQVDFYGGMVRTISYRYHFNKPEEI